MGAPRFPVRARPMGAPGFPMCARTHGGGDVFSIRLRVVAAAMACSLTLSAVTRAYATDFQVRGLLDVVMAEPGRAYEHNVLTRGDSPFDAYGLRVFADAQVNGRLQVFSQLVVRDATAPYLDGAYLMFTPSLERDLHVLAGKIPWAIGTYAPRTYSNHNPLIGTPLMYQYHTTLVWYAVPPNADALLATAGSGEYGVNYFGSAMSRGMALVDDSYWDMGATMNGSQRPLEYSLSVTTGTPGWGNTTADENHGKSVLGRLGLAALPGVRVGVSGAYGPYLVSALNPDLPPGKSSDDYHQKLAMADLELLANHAELRAEGAYNVWESPTVGNLKVSSAYAELKYTLPFSAFFAGRWDVMRFGDILDSSGAARPWDSNVDRLEGGVGYRFTREAVGKLVYQRTRIDDSDPRDQDLSMVAAQASIAF
jgi:hypothetical protein